MTTMDKHEAGAQRWEGWVGAVWDSEVGDGVGGSGVGGSACSGWL